MEISLLSGPNYVELVSLLAERFGILWHAQEADLHIAGFDCPHEDNFPTLNVPWLLIAAASAQTNALSVSRPPLGVGHELPDGIKKKSALKPLSSP